MLEKGAEIYKTPNPAKNFSDTQQYKAATPPACRIG